MTSGLHELCVYLRFVRSKMTKVWNTAVFWNTVKHLYPEIALTQYWECAFPFFPFVSLDAVVALLSHTSSPCHFIASFVCGTCCSFLIRFRHLSLATSSPSDSSLLLLFRFIGVIWRYLLLLGCVSLNTGDTKPLIIRMLALWRTFVIKMFYWQLLSCMMFLNVAAVMSIYAVNRAVVLS